MEKAVKLVMCSDKSIKIFVNEEEKHRIDAADRSISAEDIYQIYGFSAGDHYTVASENEADIDAQVLEFFTDLISDVAKKVNAIEAEDGCTKAVATE